MPYVAIGAAVAAVASAYMKKRSAEQAGGGDFIPPIDNSLHFFGGEKTINFSGGVTETMKNFALGGAVVLVIAWLKKAKGKK